MAPGRAWRRDGGTTIALALVALFPVAVLGALRTGRLHDRGELSATGLLWVGATAVPSKGSTRCSAPSAT